MRRFILVALVMLAFNLKIFGQQDDKSYRLKILESAIGTWKVSNDTLFFQLIFVKCKKAYSRDTVDGLKGSYKCIVKKKKGRIKSTSEGREIEADNAYTDYVNYPNNISMYFYDELKKKSTVGSIKVVGDTLYWRINPYIDTHPVTVYGKVISNPQYPKGWSVPIKAVLYRVKGEKE